MAKSEIEGQMSAKQLRLFRAQARAWADLNTYRDKLNASHERGDWTPEMCAAVEQATVVRAEDLFDASR